MDVIAENCESELAFVVGAIWALASGLGLWAVLAWLSWWLATQSGSARLPVGA